MKKLTVFILGSTYHLIDNNYVDIVYLNEYNYDSIMNAIKGSKGKYVSFIREEDMVTDRYLSSILSVIDNNYDCIYIQNKVAYNYINQPKILTNKNKLKSNLPYFGSYIWSYVLNKNKLLKVLGETSVDKFNELIDKTFKNSYSLDEIVYYHMPSSKATIKSFPYVDIREINYYKNIVYVGNYCDGSFNGYISWLLNIGRVFGKKYDITILYDNMPSFTINRFSKYFRCVKYDRSINYLCNRLLVTYSNYFYPLNIYHMEHNYMFIHGIMCDYNSCKYTDDIYDEYIAVSKTASKGAEGYFPTKNIKALLNPFSLDMELVETPLKLVSAQRSSKIKRMDRIEKLAKILDQEGIPYTWNVFSDYKENTNVKGLVFRERVLNPLPYISDADYFILLSDSEAMPYSILEALALNTRVIVSDIDVYKELGINSSNGIIIPRNYFDDGNEEKLVDIVYKMYEEKDKIFKYTYDSSLYEGYNDIFS